METDNELIADFMGAKVYTDWGLYLDNTYYKFKHGKPTNDSPLTFEEIEHNRAVEQMAIWNPKYDTSWDWIIPVVQKFLSLYAHSDHTKEWCAHSFRIRNRLSTADIDDVYESIVEFIKWYNSRNL